MENLLTTQTGFFNFQSKGFLLLNFLIPIIIYLEFYVGRKTLFSLNKLKEFIDSHLLKHVLSSEESKKSSILRVSGLALFVLFSSIALANPRWDYTEVASYRASTNILFLLDVSQSMLAQDEKPSRIERAKQEIVDIVNVVENANFGLIAFAEQAHTISPITSDKKSFTSFLPAISPNLISVQGSNIKNAISSANLLLESQKGGVNYIVILSDGAEKPFKEPVKLKNADIIIYGFGSNEGAPIPLKSGGFLKHKGKLVLTKINVQNLQSIAGVNKYIKASYLDDDLDTFKAKLRSKQIIESSKYSNLKIWQDKFYIFVVLLILVILPFFAKGSKFPVIILMLLLPSLSNAQAVKEPPSKKQEKITEKPPSFLDRLDVDSLEYNFFKNPNQQALIDIENREYKQAEAKFTANYNRGVAAYRSSDYKAAEDYFIKDKSLDSTYNKGNAQLKQLKAKIAIKTYEQVLKDSPEHSRAKKNLEIAKQLLKKQQRDKKKSDKKKKDKKLSGKNNQKDQNNKNSKNKKQQNQKSKPQNQSADNKPSNKSQNELERNAERLFSKIEGSPENLLKNRFRLKEKKFKKGQKIYKPW